MFTRFLPFLLLTLSVAQEDDECGDLCPKNVTIQLSKGYNVITSCYEPVNSKISVLFPNAEVGDKIYNSNGNSTTFTSFVDVNTDRTTEQWIGSFSDVEFPFAYVKSSESSKNSKFSFYGDDVCSDKFFNETAKGKEITAEGLKFTNYVTIPNPCKNDTSIDELTFSGKELVLVYEDTLVCLFEDYLGSTKAFDPSDDPVLKPNVAISIRGSGTVLFPKSCEIEETGSVPSNRRQMSEVGSGSGTVGSGEEEEEEETLLSSLYPSFMTAYATIQVDCENVTSGEVRSFIDGELRGEDSASAINSSSADHDTAHLIHIHGGSSDDDKNVTFSYFVDGEKVIDFSETLEFEDITHVGSLENPFRLVNCPVKEEPSSMLYILLFVPFLSLILLFFGYQIFKDIINIRFVWFSETMSV